MTIYEAFAHQEGFFVEGSRPRRNNNPGDLELNDFTKRHGGVAEDGPNPRFAKFETSDAGWEALRILLTNNYQHLTVEGAINKFAPSTENNTTAYVKAVCGMVDCTPETPLSTLL